MNLQNTNTTQDLDTTEVQEQLHNGMHLKQFVVEFLFSEPRPADQS